MSLKDRISSPLEAGPSILDAHHLPPHLGPALDYASSRLAQRSLHLTLVVGRRDYQIPSAPRSSASSSSASTPLSSPAWSTPSTPGSPPPLTPSGRFNFTSLKNLVRSASVHDAASTRSSDSLRSAVSSPTFPSPASESPRLRSRWPLSPMSPQTPQPMTPCTPSSVTTDTTGPLSQSSFGMRLVHDADLPPRAERTLRRTLIKAEQKFGVGNTWLSPAISPNASGLTKHLIQNSILQNEILFSSEGLTLVSFDRLYSLKSALSCYSKTKSPMRLEDAVDELRRYVLANGGIKVTKSDLLRSYDWLSVSNSAISDLDHMYRRAYGGPRSVGAISGMPKERIHTIMEPAIRIDDESDYDEHDNERDDEPENLSLEDYEIGIAITTAEESKPCTPRVPILKLQTSFDIKPTKLAQQDQAEDDEEEERTARPIDKPYTLLRPWPASSIDQILSADVSSPARSSMQYGPITPNGYEDISPTTQGEWGFLMVDNAFQGGRTVAVETCC